MPDDIPPSEATDSSERMEPVGEAADGEATAAPTPWYREIRTYVIAVLALGVLVVGGVSLAYWRIYSTAEIPSPDELAIADPTVVLDRDGEQVARLDPGSVRENIEVQNLPDHVGEAVRAAEDRDFYEHEGWSLPAIVRAAWENVTTGRTVEGASTITQQYVELAVEDVDNSYLGKFREVAIAAKLDDELSKDRILEFYLNSVPLGRGARGIEAAAQTYFGVPATELNVNQAATLAGMIAAPTANDPGRNPEAAEFRRNYVLDGMVEIGALDASRAQELADSPLPEIRTDPLVEFGPNAYFLDAVREQIPGLLEDDKQDVFSGLVIHTTLDQSMQETAVATVDDVLEEVSYSTALTTIEVESGAVRSLIGGRDYQEQQFNVAVQGSNQVGSSFKPYVLTEFVAQGYDPRRSTVEAPRIKELESASGDSAEIHNYSRSGYGTVSVESATVNSINTAYVNLGLEVGIPRVTETAHRLGIDNEIPDVPTAAIGAADLLPVEMAEAYASLAAEGSRQESFLVSRIETHEGETLYEHHGDARQAVDKQTANVVTDVLREVVQRGTGTAAQLDRPVAGKTGTTNEYRDAWFVGYTPRFATSVWIGTLDNSPMEGNVTGGSIPANLWQAYMSEIVAPFEVLQFPEPDYSGLEAVYGIDGDPSSEDTETESPSPAPSPDDSPSPSPSPAPSSSPGTTSTPSPTSSPAPSDDPTTEGPVEEIIEDTGGDSGEP